MGSFGRRALTVATVAGTLAFGVAGVGVGAQDATPMAGMGPLPNHIHEGTCDDLNPAPLVPLADLVFASPMAGDAATPATTDSIATPVGGMAMMGESIPVAVATTEVDLPLDQIIAGGHAINVHSPEDIAIYVACGNIVGTPDAQGNLFIGLGERNHSGMSGVAWLLADGDQTTVTVFLSGEAEMMGMADQATDDAEDAVGTPTA